jgi:hypothetical protein
MVTYACDPSIQMAEARESWVQGQPKLHSKTLERGKERIKFRPCFALLHFYQEVLFPPYF